MVSLFTTLSLENYLKKRGCLSKSPVLKTPITVFLKVFAITWYQFLQSLGFVFIVLHCMCRDNSLRTRKSMQKRRYVFRVWFRYCGCVTFPELLLVADIHYWRTQENLCSKLNTIFTKTITTWPTIRHIYASLIQQYNTE
jgi:hypothetical protein